MPSPNEVVLEPAAREFATATSQPPYLYQLPVEEGRNALEELQSGEDLKLEAGLEEFSVDGGPTGTVRLRLVRPPGLPRPAPVILYLHGAGWVFGSPSTHDRLVRELAVGAQAAVVFPHYARSPEARYPVALEQCWSAATWIVRSGRGFGLDPDRMMVAGDSVGGNLAIALTLLAKQRGAVRLAGQLLFYPVTDASFDTGSYRDFAEGYYLRREGMQWFWDQYTTDPAQRAEITASPLRASVDQLAGLPPALVITAEADVLRDEGEAYAAKLRTAGVPVIATRYGGIIHDFVMLDALRHTCAADAAIASALTFLEAGLGTG